MYNNGKNIKVVAPLTHREIQILSCIDLTPGNWSDYNVRKIRTKKGDTWLEKATLRSKSLAN